MPRIAALVLCVTLVLSAVPGLAAEIFSGAGDLPLPAGLKEQPDKGATFDTPLGPVMTAYAAGNAKPRAVLDFYDDALPRLGWERESSGTYRRKNQILKIDVWGPDAGPCKVSYTLSSQKP